MELNIRKADTAAKDDRASIEAGKSEMYSGLKSTVAKDHRKPLKEILTSLEKTLSKIEGFEDIDWTITKKEVSGKISNTINSPAVVASFKTGKGKSARHIYVSAYDVLERDDAGKAIRMSHIFGLTRFVEVQINTSPRDSEKFHIGFEKRLLRFKGFPVPKMGKHPTTFYNDQIKKAMKAIKKTLER